MTLIKQTAVTKVVGKTPTQNRNKFIVIASSILGTMNGTNNEKSNGNMNVVLFSKQSKIKQAAINFITSATKLIINGL